jgi:hypothetical protein
MGNCSPQLSPQKHRQSLRSLFSSFLSRTDTFLQESSMTSCTTSTSTSIAQDASFAFWFPLGWTIVGAVFTIFSFVFSLYVTLVRRDFVPPQLDSLVAVLWAIRGYQVYLRAVQSDVAVLKMALAAPGQPLAETLRTLQELMTDLLVLAEDDHETREIVTGLMTDRQEPVLPVLLEILAELRKSNGNPQIQRGLQPFSFQAFLIAQTKVLARERIQATPNPFLDLD